MSETSERYLVLGGTGFLGSYIANALVERGEQHVSVFDLKEPPSLEYRNTRAHYYTGDICDITRIVDVLQQTRATAVFHTIAPVHGSPDHVQQRVTVDGTKTVIEPCHHPSLNGAVTKLIYTSSTGVVWTSRDIAGGTEDDTPVPIRGYDSYHYTKAIGERLVLAEDGNKMRTVVLRPCGMIGPRDQQLMHRLDAVLKGRQHKIQIGDNKNLVDYAYAGNVADAHLLAADRLPAIQNESTTVHPHLVAGQVFFVTDGSPLPAWDFSRMVWRELGAPLEDLDERNVTVIPRWLALCLARIVEVFCRLLGRSTEFTVFAVQYTTATQWYNIDKARNVLGYTPRTSLKDAVRMTADWWKERGAAEYAESQGRHRLSQRRPSLFPSYRSESD